MAPVNGSFKPRRSAVSSRLAPKPVVPALPLRFVKRQTAPLGVAAVTAIPPVSTIATEATDDKEQTNGNQQVKSNEPEQGSSDLTTDTPHAVQSLPHNGPQVNHVAAADANSQSIDAAPIPLPASNGSTAIGNRVTNHTGTNPARATDPIAAEHPTPRRIPEPSSEALAHPHGASAAAVNSLKFSATSSDKAFFIPSTSLRIPDTISDASTVPACWPTHGHRGERGSISRPSTPLPNGPPHMHQAHLSNGSVHFGAFRDSQSSSPAPPHSGGIAPPPGMPMPDGRAPHMMHPNGNGFPPMMPYGAEMIPGTNFDTYGRPAGMPYGPMDYPPYGNALGPSTPHSFHDSQSSAHPEEGGMFNQYPPGLRNGAVGPVDDSHTTIQSRLYGPHDYPRMMPNPNVPPPHMMSPGDNADGLVGYIQQQFASLDLADCALELRYTDDRAPPVRIPGHRFMFARSFQLFNLLRKQTFQADGSPQTLLLETESKWIRSDSFYMAVQRLYGLPLLHAPPRRNNVDTDVTDAGTANDQFEFAISYAAAGHLLEWGSVLRRGCEVATHLLSWQTLERALEFALEGYTDRGTHESHKYSDGSKILLGAVVTFIVHNFPSHFNLDADSTEPVPFARLPLHPLPPPSTVVPITDNVVSSTAPGVSGVQLGKGRRSQQLSGIQFGDLSFIENKNGGSATETPKATHQAQPTTYTTLSRILLDLPFAQLKMILESSGSGNVNGWANAEARYRLIKTAVDERESRRHRVLEAVLSGRVPDADMIRAGLRSPEPRDLGPWTALGWQEDMLPFGNPDGPSLARKWVPLMEPPNGSVAEYP
ncbi:hypothetical protein PT974_03646 [Cladobotryum mycophilum]|uniref:BTB domain-containing protein n=1 Tax=Cladobotryum mycophilum TaxID=491253 RepID=A0ABR0SSX6_9HYPO